MKRKLLNLFSVITLLLFSGHLIGQTNTWNGSSSTSWNNDANWSLGTVPVATDDVIIADVANQPLISSGTIALSDDFRVVTGATLTIESGGGLTIAGNLTLFGDFIINSSSSNSGTLIVNGSASAGIVYNRFVTGGGWYLISAPVSSVSASDLFNDNPGVFRTGNPHIFGFGNNLAIGGYNGTTWSYMNSFGFGGPSVSAGTGVSVNLISSGSVTMNGGLNGSVSKSLTTDTFNLLGNPYPATLNPATFTSANTGKLTQETVWVRSGSGYTAVNSMSSTKIAPGQGFWVRANGTGGSANFTRTNQSHDAADDFNKSAPFASYELSVENNGAEKSTKVFYAENRTTGFDNGSDSSLFSDNDDFFIYTELVTDSEGQKLEIQTLPDENIESYVVPLGVKAVAESEITFSIETSNFDENLKIYLEDRVSNTFTRLDEVNSMYKVTPETDLDGVGRFYVHASQTALSVDTNEWLSTVQIYKLNNANVRITGLAQGNASVRMYNVMGKEVLSTSFNAAGTKDITLPNNISKGVYFVKLETADGILNKKIIVE